MFALKLNLLKNTVSWQTRTVEFRRAHTASFLHRLLINGIHGLSTRASDVHFAAAGTLLSSAYGRQQWARLVDELTNFFQAHPELGIAFEHADRKVTVGPWRLKMIHPLSVSAADDESENSWPFPVLIDNASSEQLRELLAGWLTFEGFGAYAEHRPALEMIPSLQIIGLTFEAKALLQMRRIYFLRRLDEYDSALELAANLLQSAAQSKDTRLATQTQMILARIEYERDPATRWRSAQALLAQPPIIVAPCPMTHAEWHNLNALCSRRAALEAFEAGDRQLALKQHELAIKHFQSALYFALSLQSWDRVHAYIDNLCYHLQKMYLHQVVSIQEALGWYSLALACADKLDSGHDDSWDLIYFAEFYLDNRDQIFQAQKQFAHRSGLLEDANSPDKQGFWDGALKRARSAGSKRQMGITLVLYLRWSLQYHQNAICPTNVRDLKLELNQLLELNPELTAQLCEDGYDGWLQRVSQI